MKIEIEKLVNKLKDYGFEVVEVNKREIVLRTEMYTDNGLSDYAIVTIPKDNPVLARITYGTSRSVPGWSYCGANGQWYSDREFDERCPGDWSYLFLEYPKVFESAIRNGWSYSNTIANKDPSPNCLESVMKFRVPDTEKLKMVVERYGGVLKKRDKEVFPEPSYLPELFLNPKASRLCVVNLILRLMKLGFTPVTNVFPEKDCYPNPFVKGFVGFAKPLPFTEHAVDSFLTLTGISERIPVDDILNKTIELPRDKVVFTARAHLLMMGVISKLINAKPSDYGERVRVLYALPLWNKPPFSAFLVGLNKRGSDNVFNRVVYIAQEFDSGYLRIVAGNSMNWLPREVMPDGFSAIYDIIQKTSSKKIGVAVHVKEISSKNWVERTGIGVKRVKFGRTKLLVAS